MRHRGSVVIIQDNNVCFIKRVRAAEVYYVFPGGGIEVGETAEEAAIREAYEELGVRVRIMDLLQKLEYHGTQYYFRAEIIDGAVGSGQGEEYTDQARNRGSYLPVWVGIEQLQNLDVRPREIANTLCKITN